MNATVGRRSATGTARAPGRRLGTAGGLAAAALGLGLSAWAVWSSVTSGPSRGEVLRDVLLAAWAAAGALLAIRRPAEPLGVVVLAGVGVGSAATLWPDVGGLAAAVLPAIGLHLALGLPDGRLRSPARRAVAVAAYVAAGIAGTAWIGPEAGGGPGWLVPVEAGAAVVGGALGFAARYGRLGPGEQRRMKWAAWAATVSAGAAVAAAGLHVLVRWPPAVGEIAAAATLVVPAALVLGISPGAGPLVDRLLAATVSLAGLTAVVVAVYLAVVLGLGRVPRREERALLVLSMVAAGLAALLYLPAHARLRGLATRIVYGERRAPDDLIRNFSARMSRALPLDELLLQLAESLRRTFGLASAEVWTAAGGGLELAVSDPERPRERISLQPSEESTIARAGISGPAWMRIWLPSLLAGREDAQVRVAPAAHSGELLGLIVVERAADAEPFTEPQERTLAELARQVGVTLHNVRLDSALQASLDEVRKQAGELQASRKRIVAAADAERRKIERNLHDGAQQHLVALAVKVRLARQLGDRDPERAKAMLDQLGADVQETIQEVRDLAHGIYPPLLADKGLPQALAAAARRAALPVDVQADGIGRHPQEVESAVYFCVLEALQNAAKYAGPGAGVQVLVREDGGALLFDVVDDGAGFDVRHRSGGAGFTNMSDRLGAIGGSLRVESAPGRGTRVSGVIPLAR